MTSSISTRKVGRRAMMTELFASVRVPLAVGVADHKSAARSVTSLALLLMFGSAIVSAGTLFRSPVAYDAGGNGTSSIAVADVNRDGIADLIVANTGGVNTAGGSVGVLLGNGDGTFKPPLTYALSGAAAVAVGDVNGDGKPDIVVTGSYSPVAVFLGNGDGTFQPVQVYGTGPFITSSIALGDMNGDGKLDVIIGIGDCAPGVCGSDGAVGVFLGKGDGSFKKVHLYDSGGSPGGPGGRLEISLVVADVNEDGKLDVLVANPGGAGTGGVGVIGVLLGRGDGTLKAVRTFGAGDGFDASSIAVADVNNDGKEDLVVANYCATELCPGTGTGSVAVLLGNGNGTFQTAQTYDSAGYGASGIAVADVNGDGEEDLVVVNQSADNIRRGLIGVLLGNGDGTFQPAQTYSTHGQFASAIALANLNRDTKLDIVAANANLSGGDGTVGVLLGK
jgi:hypothetical protein